MLNDVNYSSCQELWRIIQILHISSAYSDCRLENFISGFIKLSPFPLHLNFSQKTFNTNNTKKHPPLTICMLHLGRSVTSQSTNPQSKEYCW